VSIWDIFLPPKNTSFKKITLPPMSTCFHTTLHVTENYCLPGCFAMHSGINPKRFGETYYLYIKNGDNMFLQNTGIFL
jgi:hypothetical protein